MTKPEWMTTRYAYKTDHVVRAALALSLSINVGLAILVWTLIGLLWVWRP